jgi:RNA polymerase sigma-70 factor (ECF subfamily)
MKPTGSKPSTKVDETAPEEEQEIDDWTSVVKRDAERPRNSSSTATSWTLIEDAVNDVSPTNQDSRNELMKRYWSAVYAFIRSSGRSEQKAEDLTQGFFCDVIIGRGLLDRADASRGRFRSLLLSAVRNYMADEYRMRTAQRRSPGKNALGRLDDETGLEAISEEVDPESAFNTRWVDELIERTSEQVREELMAGDQAMHWDIFKSRILNPCLTGAAPVPHEDLARKWGLRGLPQVSNLLVTAKRRYAKALIENVRETLPKGASASSELTELFNALGRRK